jgi:glycosyltransferase involved in cell wall biosynthesis
MKILFINNYPMDVAWKSWQDGIYPGHHLWGITHLHKYRIDVDILPYEKYVILNKIGKNLRLGGYLDQQIRMIFKSSSYDVIYSGCQDNSFLISFLKYLKIFNKPIYSLIHNPITKSKKNRIFIEAQNKLFFLSKSVMTQVQQDFNINEQKIELLEWGVDLPFYQYKMVDHDNYGTMTSQESTFIISAGKANRDHDTLVKAFSNINFPLKIYCSAASAPTFSILPPNIEVIFNHPVNNAISYRELLREYRRAYAITIPLKDTSSLAGLTSLLDAMAMSKAVIMTRNNQIDIDIEKEKIGIWVEPGDIEGWKQAISYLLKQPDETVEMGLRGCSLCKSKYNIEEFSSKLAKCFSI